MRVLVLKFYLYIQIYRILKILERRMKKNYY